MVEANDTSSHVVEQLKQLAEALEDLQIPDERGPVKTKDGEHVGCPECGYPLGSQDGKIMPCALCGWLDKPTDPRTVNSESDR